MSVTSESVLKSLSSIIHPELGKDIVSLGLVQGLQIADNSVSFTLALLKRNDPFASSVRRACEKVLVQELGEGIKVSIGIKAASATPKESPYRTKASVSRVKNIVAVASGKGGVGKSTVAVNLAVALARKGLAVGLLDADIFGPSGPKMLGLEGCKPTMMKEDDLELIQPVEGFGVKHLSVGFFVEANSALIWRGPMASNALKQLIHQEAWGELDFLLVDTPPGTSDIHLSLVQELALTGAIIVSTPQDVAIADAVKGISMFSSVGINVPILGLVENMAWFTPVELPNNRYYLFGREGCKRLAERMHIPLLGQIPLVQSIREGGDDGVPAAAGDGVLSLAFEELAANVSKAVEQRNLEKPPTQRVEVSPR